ncbi:MAG: PspC domain-containing protein [Bacteroidales bacterium]|nr:PspC domain-containing protein [Bacteroidales bacterium]
MKKTINVAIGGCSFTIDEDAYKTLDDYLERFKGALDPSISNKDVMDELEGRIADLLKSRLGGREVVDFYMAQQVVGQLGYPQGYKPEKEQSEGAAGAEDNVKDEYHYSGTDGERPVRKLFRDGEGKKIAGVCSGIALFLGIDVTLIRIIFIVALICGSAGFWIYLVIWIAAPEARTAAEKCELRGIPANAENIRRFTQGK